MLPSRLPKLSSKVVPVMNLRLPEFTVELEDYGRLTRLIEVLS